MLLPRYRAQPTDAGGEVGAGREHRRRCAAREASSLAPANQFFKNAGVAFDNPGTARINSATTRVVLLGFSETEPAMALP